jgi:hypothetical protein
VLSDRFAEDKAYFLSRGLDLATELAAPSLAARDPAYQVAYFDARREISCFLELYAAAPVPLALFEHWKKAHDNWDGKSDPIRKSELPANAK